MKQMYEDSQMLLSVGVSRTKARLTKELIKIEKTKLVKVKQCTTSGNPDTEAIPLDPEVG
jgi:hypothetical protein